MTHVRATGTGELILCAWDDCETPGHDEIHIDQTSGGRKARYIFCTERHRQYYRNSPRSHGNLGTTMRRSPLGLWMPSAT